MAVKKKDLKKIEKDLAKLWERTKKYLKKAADESLKIAKKGEENIKVFSQKSKLSAEALLLRTRQERLYSNLGKAVFKTGKLTSKKVRKLHKEIKGLEKEIKDKKRKAKKL